MALLTPHPLLSFQAKTKIAIRPSASRSLPPWVIRCMPKREDQDPDSVSMRRSANYYPSIWKHEYLQALENKYQIEEMADELSKLREQVLKLFDVAEASNTDKLTLVDVMLRLGIRHHFEKEIKNVLTEAFAAPRRKSCDNKSMCLYTTSLEFRLLRQDGFNAPPDVFERFLDEENNFTRSSGADLEAVLSLYEASYLSLKGERVLKDAKKFASEYLRKYMDRNPRHGDTSEYFREITRHALEMPYHRRTRLPEIRWFIDVYRRSPDMNPPLLKLAVINFNMTQSLHREELKALSRWWEGTGIARKLSFSRDRIVENYFWSAGLNYSPDFSYFRKVMTKVIGLIAAIDDIYDIYGTVEELQCFTEAVKSWDKTFVRDLPDGMRSCVFALYDTLNEISHDILRDKKIDVLPYLKQAWGELCEAYTVEAGWFYSGYKPTLDEYLKNGYVSSCMPMLLLTSVCILQEDICRDTLDALRDRSILRCCAMLIRLTNDLGTSSEEMKRGDVPKSLQCYMHENRASEEEARRHVWQMVEDWLDEINKEMVTSHIGSFECLQKVALNFVRCCFTFYQFGDGYGTSSHLTKDVISSSFFEPITNQV